MGKIQKLIHDPRAVLAGRFTRTKMLWHDDEQYLKILYRLFYGRKLNLDNPQLFSEKMQWLKLNYRKSIFTKMVDKYEAKKLVSDELGGVLLFHATACGIHLMKSTLKSCLTSSC